MFTTRPDLFPETLLVALIDGHPMTDTRKIAEHFGKRHDTVLRTVKSLIASNKDPVRLRNFAESSYLNEQGKRQPMYLLNRDAFIFVVGGFTGEAAQEWKWSFIDGFNAMECELHAQRDRYVSALDLLCPPLRPTVERTQATQDRASIASVIGKSCASVTYYRSKGCRLGLL